MLSDSSTFTTILTTIPPNLVVIDSDVQNGADLLPAVFQLPQPPESVTIRDDSTLPLPAGQERLVRVGTQISEADW